MTRRVCHLTYEYPPRIYGGLGRHTGELTSALVQRGWHVAVATVAHSDQHTDAGPPAVEVQRVADIPVIGDGSDWLAAVAAFDRGLLDVAEPLAAAADLLHVHDWFAAETALTLQRRHRLPLVLTVHATERGRHQGWLPGPVSRFVDDQERRLTAAAAQVIVCSTWMRDAIAQWWDLDTARITVVPNGVAIAEDLRTDRAGVLLAGRCEYEKGGHVLLQALALLGRRGISAQLTVAGEGSQRAAWETLAGELGLSVRFVGVLDDGGIIAAYRSASVVAVPSLYEPFGLVAAEALATGAPVVATAVGGLIETLGDGGTLVPPDDAEALAGALEPLLTDLAAQAAAQRLARDRAAQLPSWDEVAAQTEQVYLRALDGTAPRIG